MIDGNEMSSCCFEVDADDVFKYQRTLLTYFSKVRDKFEFMFLGVVSMPQQCFL